MMTQSKLAASTTEPPVVDRVVVAIIAAIRLWTYLGVRLNRVTVGKRLLIPEIERGRAKLRDAASSQNQLRPQPKQIMRQISVSREQVRYRFRQPKKVIIIMK